MTVILSDITISFILVGIVGVVAVGALTFFIFLNKKPTANMLEKVGETWMLAGTKKFVLGASEIIWKNKKFPLSLEGDYVILGKRKQPIVYFDAQNIRQLKISEDTTFAGSSEKFNTVTENGILAHLLGKNMDKMTMAIILVLSIALVISVGVTIYVIQNPQAFIHIASNATKTIASNYTSPISPVSP